MIKFEIESIKTYTLVLNQHELDIIRTLISATASSKTTKEETKEAISILYNAIYQHTTVLSFSGSLEL